MENALAHPEFGDDAAAFRVVGRPRISDVIEAARRLSKKNDFVVALKAGPGIVDRLIPAYINAAIRNSEGSMHADSLALEVMMFVSGKMNIGKAIESVGAEDGKEFILFSNRGALAEKVVSDLGLKVLEDYELRLELDASGSVSMTAIRDDK